MKSVTGDCYSCAHPWQLHPVAVATITACAACIAEEDRDDRRTDEMCVRVPPPLALMRASDVVTAISDTDFLGRHRVRLRWRDGQTWQTFRRRSWSSTAGTRWRRSVEEDLASLTVGELWEKYGGDR